MTGEMYQIDPITATEPDGTVWEYHSTLARGLRQRGFDATVQPFDQYQGPYVLIGEDFRMGPYAAAVQGMGVIRLWLSENGYDGEGAGEGAIYREDTDTAELFILESPESLVNAALSLLY